MTWVTAVSRLVPELEALCVRLRDAGVKATTDRARLEVPGAWVRPDTVSGPLTLAGGYRARVSVLLVVPASGDAQSLTALAGLLDQALTVIDPDEDVDTSVVLPHNNNALPAFRLVVDLDLEEE